MKNASTKSKKPKQPTFTELLFECKAEKILEIEDAHGFAKDLEKLTTDFNKKVVALGKRHGIKLMEKIRFSVDR